MRRPSPALALLLSAGPALGCPFLMQRRRLGEDTEEDPHRSLRAAAPPADAIHAAAAARRRLETCAAAGQKAMQCGANENPANAALCCDDLVCAASGNTQKCVPPLMNVDFADWPTEHRSYDGSGNNPTNHEWGKAGEALRREVTADYEAGNGLNDAGRPNPREVSNAIGSQTASKENAMGATDLLWQWGQFLDHDLSLTEHSGTEMEPIDVSGDPVLTGQIDFVRSDFEDDAATVRQQINSITSYIDASHIYGSDAARAESLRAVGMPDSERGKLAVQTVARIFDDAEEYFLPHNTNGLPNAGDGPEFFLAGDIRANEQVGLTALHTLFVREHNWWAKRIWDRYHSDPSADLSDEGIYQMARTMVAAEIQAITYNEWLRVLLGPDWDADAPYDGYDSTVNPEINNVFSTAAFRVGHTLVSDRMLCLSDDGTEIAGCSMDLKDLFFQPDKILNFGIGPFLKGLSAQVCQEVDTQVVDSLRNDLFVRAGDDLLARNIQRGRDHGLGSYNDVREAFGLPRVQNFNQFNFFDPNIKGPLVGAYGSGNIDDLDAIVGMFAEAHVPGAMVGETIREVLKDQFLRLRDGDRFWYEKAGYLPADLMAQVDRCTLEDIVIRNTEITGGITFKKE